MSSVIYDKFNRNERGVLNLVDGGVNLENAQRSVLSILQGVIE